MKTLYLECNSGISGDMTVAALLDLGADEPALLSGLKSLNVGGYDIKVSRVKKRGIDACDFNVLLHGEHSHEHGHKHEHRNISDINEIIGSADITAASKDLAKKIFRIIAEAEAKVHGLPVSEVHFHEAGAVDSIVDIVSAAVCLDNLGIEQVICTPLYEGQGHVMCQHGLLPVPVPATFEIASSHKIPVIITQNQGEMITPTGAAIVAAIASEFAPPNNMTVLKTGYGAGKKDFAAANVLRASIVEFACPETDLPENVDVTLELSCNLDDMTGEQLAYACELLLRQGAYDCWLTPIIMKKGRPAQTLSLLIDPLREAEFVRLLFLHTSTIGVRIAPRRRFVMRRESVRIETEYGTLDAKESSYDDICKTSIEYKSAKSLAESHSLPISAIYRAGQNASK